MKCRLCARPKCKGGKPCTAATRRRIAELTRTNVELAAIRRAKLPSLERCQEVEQQIAVFNRALVQTKERSRLLDADISQRYILIQALTAKLASVIGNAAAEAFVRAYTGGVFVRSLGPLEPILAAMHLNIEAAERARAEPTLALPEALPKLITYEED